MNPEDEAWAAIEAKQKRAVEIDKLQRAAVAAALFVSESPKRELAIMTLRKAFELGYRQGWSDKK